MECCGREEQAKENRNTDNNREHRERCSHSFMAGPTIYIMYGGKECGSRDCRVHSISEQEKKHEGSLTAGKTAVKETSGSEVYRKRLHIFVRQRKQNVTRMMSEMIYLYSDAGFSSKIRKIETFQPS